MPIESMSPEKRQRFREWLTSYVHVDDARVLYVHLADIRDACANVVHLIDLLPTQSVQQAAGRAMLAELRGELSDHLPAHLNEVKSTFDRVVTAVFEGADERGEL